MPEATPVDAEVVNEPTNGVSASVPNIRFNLGTTLQSPFFWLVVGVGIGMWMGWDKGNKKSNDGGFW